MNIESHNTGIERAEGIEIEKIVDAILFDWDGVLYDGMHNIGLICLEVCRKYGKEVTMEYFMENYTQPYWKFYEKIGIDTSQESETQEIYNLYHQIRGEMGLASHIYPEVETTLRQLAERNLQLGIMSAGQLDRIIKILEDNGLIDFFDSKHIITGQHKKDDAIRQFYEQNNLDPKRVLMVGDLPSDLEDGKAAGVKVAAIARFDSAVPRLTSYNPDYLLSDLGEIIKPIPLKK